MPIDKIVRPEDADRYSKDNRVVCARKHRGGQGIPFLG